MGRHPHAEASALAAEGGRAQQATQHRRKAKACLEVQLCAP